MCKFKVGDILYYSNNTKYRPETSLLEIVGVTDRIYMCRVIEVRDIFTAGSVHGWTHDFIERHYEYNVPRMNADKAKKALGVLPDDGESETV